MPVEPPGNTGNALLDQANTEPSQGSAPSADTVARLSGTVGAVLPAGPLAARVGSPATAEGGLA